MLEGLETVSTQVELNNVTLLAQQLKDTQKIVLEIYLLLVPPVPLGALQEWPQQVRPKNHFISVILYLIPYLPARIKF